ncbi:hypothetical protein QYM36_019141 [Artemia franciscana]|uniref:Reverse transcriptase domain-containing protein n=1 Tax=Artemia franciscana TaxID=6661 RepID=A0AA88H8D0_ARTSF|nr:hypothetical protein QYM36_019141 [Artemia franciscana]
MFPSRSVDAYKGRRRNPDHQLLVAQAIKMLASTTSLQPSPPAAQPPLAQPDESPIRYIDNDDQPNYSAPVGHISPSQPTKRSSRFNGTQSGVLYPGVPHTLLEHASIDDIPRSSTSVVALSIPSVDELPVPKPVPSRCPSPESRRKTRSHSRQENIRQPCQGRVAPKDGSLTLAPREPSLGPDGLRIVDGIQFGYEALAVLFNAIYFLRITPKLFLKSRTVFLRKADGAKDPADFPPISISSMLQRWLHRVIATCLARVAEILPAQTVFSQVNGSIVNTLIIDRILREAKTS